MSKRMSDQMCINHPDRPIRAQNRCGSCYVVAMRKGEITPMPRYIDEIIAEVEDFGMTWDQIEETYGRKRTTVSNALYRRKAYETLHAIQAKTYGVTGRGNINSVLPKVTQVPSYARELIEELEYHPDWTWADACAKFEGKTREHLWKVLKKARREDLIKRTNKNSGTRDISPYLEDIVRYCELDTDLTWGVLCRLLGRKEKTVRQYMLKYEQHGLVERLDKASGKGRVEL